MSKVEMSIQEYNQLMDELNMYKEIVEVFLSPKIDEWDLQWSKDHSNSPISVHSINVLESLSMKSKNYIRSTINEYIENLMTTNSLNGAMDLSTDFGIHFGHIQLVEKETEEV